MVEMVSKQIAVREHEQLKMNACHCAVHSARCKGLLL